MLLVANLDRAGVDVLLLMGEGKPSKSEADDADEDKHDAYDRCGFDVGLSMIQGFCNLAYIWPKSAVVRSCRKGLISASLQHLMQNFDAMQSSVSSAGHQLYV